MKTQRYLAQQQKALDAAHHRAREQGATRILDIDRDRYVFFSDLHRGARNGADDFWPCERAYNAALAYYFRQGYTLVVLGDVEELWEERPAAVLRSYAHSLKLEAPFHQAGRYLRIWGNHDDEWQYEHSVAQHLAPVFGKDPPLHVPESALIQVVKDGQELGHLFLVHGHQGDRFSDTPSRLPRLAVRYIWRPLQRLLRCSLNTPAREWAMRETYDQALYSWARRENALVLIAGHTHRPVFRSESHVAQLREELARLEHEAGSAPDREQLAAQSRLLAKIEWVRAQSREPPQEERSTLINVPCYFNAGCCCYSDGDITGIEIADGDIRLIRWPDKQGEPRPLALATTSLDQVLRECRYLPEREPKPILRPAASTPIIDVHAHIFRGKDIPLKGYLLARRYDMWLLRFKPLARRLFAALADCIRAERADHRRPLCRLLLRLAYKVTGQGYRNWADILSLAEIEEVAREMAQTFDKDGIDLYVPLMIDYAYWFENSAEPHIADQIEAIYQRIILPYRGRIHPFVPFDPARELAYQHGIPGPDGKPERHSSLALVQDAIRNKGFIGVKIYNTLGYRPLGNALVEEQRRRIYRENGMPHYLKKGAQAAFAGEEFDRVLRELYRFCEQEQAPITAHCVSNGVEAYWGASLEFARPIFWREVLDEFPDLHLNLAHFGWDHPEGYYPPWWRERVRRTLRQLGLGQEKKTWVGEICEMLEPYPNLFVDVAHHGVTEGEDLTKYKRSYQGICCDFPGLLPQRLLFGIDWHVIARAENYVEFKERYVQLLQELEIFVGDEIYDFLGGNSLRFLGLVPPGTGDKTAWTKNWERLAEFYPRHQIAPPGWFQALGPRR